MSTQGWLTFEGMCWADPTDPRELEWKLRYYPGSLTSGDQMALASMVSCYRSLVGLDSRTRQKRVMQLRAAITAAGELQEGREQ